MTPLHPMLVCHGNRSKLDERIFSLGGALSMRGKFSAEKSEKLSPQCLMLSAVQKNWWLKEVREPTLTDSC